MLALVRYCFGMLNWQSDNATFREQGSYRFSFAQRRSHVLALDVEIVSVISDSYLSFKSNPPNGHYGYAVVFHGSTPIRRIDLEFPAQRVVFSRNDAAVLAVRQYEQTLRLTESLRALYTCLSPPTKICADLVIVPGETRTFPGHPETIVKVKTLPGSQFNFVCYWSEIEELGASPIEIDTTDGSDDLDEYPNPDRNNPNSPWDGNPSPSNPSDGNDPRDYGDQWGYPGGTNGILVRVRVTALSGGCNSSTSSYIPGDINLGEVEGRFEGTANGDNYVCSPGAYLGFRLKAGGRVFGPFESGGGVTNVEVLSVTYT